MPRSDADFNNWQGNFIATLTNYLTDLGLTAEEITPITTAQTPGQRLTITILPPSLLPKVPAKTKTIAVNSINLYCVNWLINFRLILK